MSRKKKKRKQQNDGSGEGPNTPKPSFDPELLRMYLTGAANPSTGNKFEKADDIVDLHIGKPETGKGGKIPPEDALFIQLDRFEKALDKAIATGNLELRVIHGLGTGKLRREIFKILDKHPNVRSYENSYHSKYGFGSTLISLQ